MKQVHLTLLKEDYVMKARRWLRFTVHIQTHTDTDTQRSLSFRQSNGFFSFSFSAKFVYTFTNGRICINFVVGKTTTMPQVVFIRSCSHAHLKYVKSFHHARSYFLTHAINSLSFSFVLFYLFFRISA